MLLNPELEDSVIDMNHCIPGCINRHFQNVSVAAVGLIHHTDAVGLNKSVILKGGRIWAR